MLLTTNEQTLFETLTSISNERSLTDSEKTLLDSLEKKINEPDEPKETKSGYKPLTYAEMVQLKKEGKLSFIKAYNEFVENLNKQGNDKEHPFKCINYATNLTLAEATVFKKFIEDLKTKTINTKPNMYNLLDKIQKKYFDNGITGNIGAGSLKEFEQELFNSLPEGTPNNVLLKELSANYKIGCNVNNQNYELYKHLMYNLVKSNLHSVVSASRVNIYYIITWLNAIESMVNYDLEESQNMFEILTVNYRKPISDFSELMLNLDLIPFTEKIHLRRSNPIVDLIKGILNN